MHKVLIIEPHGDDAIISCHSILRSPATTVDILTLSERPSEGLKQFADHLPNLGKFDYLDMSDYNWKTKPINHHTVNRWGRDGLNTYHEYLAVLAQEEDYNSRLKEVMPILDDYIRKGDYDLVFAPMGVIHPYHMVVKEAVRILEHWSDKVVYYSEPPYNGKKYGQLLEKDAAVLLATLGYGLVEFRSDFYEKEKIFATTYPTETGMFRFSKSDILENTEKYYTKQISLVTKILEEVTV